MERWSGRVAIVTGANSGIGAATAQELVKNGIKVVGLDLNVDKMEEYSTTLEAETGKLFPVKCNITDETELNNAFNWIKSNLGGVDILINNAGCSPVNNVIEGPEESWRQLLDLNVLAVSVCAKKVIQSMRERGVDDGHIVNINSVSGHMIPPIQLPMYMYSATKHAITVLTEGLRRELVQQTSKIRVTSVSPGFVKTGMMTEDVAKKVTHLLPEDIANAIMYILGAPPHVQIQELIIMPMGKQG